MSNPRRTCIAVLSATTIALSTAWAGYRTAAPPRAERQRDAGYAQAAAVDGAKMAWGDRFKEVREGVTRATATDARDRARIVRRCAHEQPGTHGLRGPLRHHDRPLDGL